MGRENFAEFHEAINDPPTVRARLEDHRAGLGVDYEHERQDRAARRRVQCPTLFLWSSRDDMEDIYGDPLAIWATWASDLRGHSIDSGHHMAEDNPQAVTQALADFYATC